MTTHPAVRGLSVAIRAVLTTLSPLNARGGMGGVGGR